MGAFRFPGHLGWGGCSPRERGSERVNQSRALVRTPRVRALGAFPVQDRCSSPSPRPPKGTSPHPSEMPPELRKMTAQKAASTLTTPPLPFLDLVIQHTLIRCSCSQPKTGLQMCLPFHHATGPLSSTAERTSWGQECAMRDHSELSLGSAP